MKHDMTPRHVDVLRHAFEMARGMFGRTEWRMTGETDAASGIRGELRFATSDAKEQEICDQLMDNGMLEFRFQNSPKNDYALIVRHYRLTKPGIEYIDQFKVLEDI